VPKVKILEYLPLLILDDQMLGCRTRRSSMYLPANTRKEKEGKAREGIGAKLPAWGQVNSQTKFCFLWV